MLYQYGSVSVLRLVVCSFLFAWQTEPCALSSSNFNLRKIMIIKNIIQRKVLSGATVLSAYTHTYTQAPAHMFAKY